jgi:hypothetical protein
MNRYILLLSCLSLYSSEQDPPKPIIRPREVIIYPPVTAAELLARQQILRDACNHPTGARITVKDKNPPS